MQASGMATFRLLLSQSHHLNRFHSLSPPINCIVFHNRLPQNPQFSRHFKPPLNSRLIHSVNHLLSTESPLMVDNSQSEGTSSNSPASEPIPEQTPRVWSMFGSDLISPRKDDSEGKTVVNRVDSEDVLEGETVENRVDSKDDSEGETVENRVNSVRNYPNSAFTGGFGGKGKKGKSKEHWVCSECGHSELKWWGSCNACKKFGTLKRFLVTENAEGGKVSGFKVSENATRSWLPEQKKGQGGPLRLSDVNLGVDPSEWRIRL